MLRRERERSCENWCFIETSMYLDSFHLIPTELNLKKMDSFGIRNVTFFSSVASYIVFCHFYEYRIIIS